MFYVIATEGGRRVWHMAGPYRQFNDALAAQTLAKSSVIGRALAYRHDLKFEVVTAHNSDPRTTLLGVI